MDGIVVLRPMVQNPELGDVTSVAMTAASDDAGVLIEEIRAALRPH